MDCNTEIEEGEACCYYKGDDDNSIDPDVAFAYIDKKLQDILGNSQKDFEGLVSAEKLGAKFGEYGSFLPTYQRAPSILSQSRAPHRNCSSLRSPVEGSFQHVTASPNIKTDAVLSTLHSSFNIRNPCADVAHKESYMTSIHETDKMRTESEPTVKHSNTVDQGSLKVRTRMGSDSDDIKQTTAAICSGLGIGDSPSSSLGNSPETSEDVHVSHNTVENSPTFMLQVMTSFPIPEGFLISPLNDSLLSFAMDDGHLKSMNPVLAHKDGQDRSSSFTEKPASFPGETSLVKGRNTKSNIKSGMVAGLVQTDKNSSGGDIMSLKKKMEKSLWNGNKPQSDDTKPTSLANTSCDAEGSVNVAVREPDACRVTGKDDFKGHFTVDFQEKGSLESIAGQKSGKSKKTKINRPLEKVRDMGALTHLNSNGMCKPDQISASTTVHLNASQPMEESKMIALPKENGCKKSIFNDHSEIKLASRGEKSLNGGKRKVKGVSGGSKLAVISNAESLKGHCEAVPKNKKSGSSGDQIRILNSEEAIGKVQNIRRKHIDRTSKQMDSKMVKGKVSGHRTKVSDFGMHESDKLKVRSTATGVDNQLITSVAVKNGSESDLHVMENGLSSDVAPAAVAPVLIAEDWVCCDRCEKWRLLPYGTKLEHLPEKWLCSMLNWLPGMNCCDVSEEETTKALHELYQPTQAPNNLQSQRNESAFQSTSGDFQHLDQNHQSMSSSAVSVPRKKKYFLKQSPNTWNSGDHVQNLDVAISKQQNSLNSKSLIDMNQTLKESKLNKKSTIKFVNKSHDMTGEMNILIPEEKKVSSKKMKIKNMEGYPHGSGVIKKMKIQSVQNSDRYQNTDTGRLGLSSSAGLSYMERKRVHNQDGHCLSEDPKSIGKVRLVVSSQDQPQHSSNALEVKTREKGDNASDKRKLKNLQIDQANHIQDRDVFSKEESSENGFRDVKKLKATKIEQADKTDVGDNELEERGKMARVLFSDDRLSLTGDIEETVRSDRDQQPKNCKIKVTSKQTLEAMDLLRRDMGSDSIMAASSSMKVSGSVKAKASNNEVKILPVESVSSSPLKFAKTDKQPPVVEDISGKDFSAHCDLAVLPKLRQLSDGQIVGDSNLSRTLSKQELSVDSRNVLALDNYNSRAGNKISSSGKCSGFADNRLDNFAVDNVEKDDQCALDLGDEDIFRCEDRIRRKQQCEKGLITANDSSLSTRNKNYAYDFEKDQMKVSDLTLREAHKPRTKYKKGGLSDGRALDALQTVTLEEEPMSGSNKESHCRIADLSLNDIVETEHNPLSPFRKDSFSQTASDVLKEAMVLRDRADHLKCSGFGFESNETYFGAALKFLHCASILETYNGEIDKQEKSEMQMYITAAKLCENCALEFEVRQEMAAAALAYKCIEVAYMRVVYCKNSNMSKDRHGLNEILQMANQGESPSSSASDVDNNPATVDKDNIYKTAGSYNSGHHGVILHTRSYFARLLDFTQDASSAMEASRKSQVAFAAANLNLNEAKKQECMAKVRRVIDLSFQDVEGLLSLVEQARRAISGLA